MQHVFVFALLLSSLSRVCTGYMARSPARTPSQPSQPSQTCADKNSASKTCYIVADAGSTKTQVHAFSGEDLEKCEHGESKSEVGRVDGSVYDNAFDSEYLANLAAKIKEAIGSPQCKSATNHIVRILGTGKFRQFNTQSGVDRSKNAEKWAEVRNVLVDQLGNDCPSVQARTLSGVEEALFGYTEAALHVKCTPDNIVGFVEMGGATLQFGYQVKGGSLGLISWASGGKEEITSWYDKNVNHDDPASHLKIIDHIESTFPKPSQAISRDVGGDEDRYVLQGGGLYYIIKDAALFYRFLNDWQNAPQERRSGPNVYVNTTTTRIDFDGKNISQYLTFQDLERIEEGLRPLKVNQFGQNETLSEGEQSVYYKDETGKEVYSPFNKTTNKYGQPENSYRMVLYIREVLKYANLIDQKFVIRKDSGWPAGAVHQSEFGGIFDDAAFTGSM